MQSRSIFYQAMLDGITNQTRRLHRYLTSSTWTFSVASRLSLSTRNASSTSSSDLIFHFTSDYRESRLVDLNLARKSSFNFRGTSEAQYRAIEAPNFVNM